MPIVNIQLAGQGKLPDGKTFDVPPQAVLTQRGPVLQVTISVGQQIAAQVLQDGGVLPSPASHSEVERSVYPIQIEVVGLPVTVNAPRAIGAPLKCQGIHVLIGRDVLQHCMFVYNGLTGSFSLSI